MIEGVDNVRGSESRGRVQFADGTLIEYVDGALNVSVSGNINIKGKQIHLND